jgi:hypothetical protein
MIKFIAAGLIGVMAGVTTQRICFGIKSKKRLEKAFAAATVASKETR